MHYKFDVYLLITLKLLLTWSVCPQRSNNQYST